ncbi:MAG: ExeA family protein [bacterium]
MYQDFFGLSNAPFSIVPDHRVVYMSESHREAVAHLLYSLKKSGGFIQLTGDVGTGKTTVSRYLLQHLPENVDVALLLNPRINEQEMLETICDELKIRYPRGPGATLKNLIGVLNYYLLASHSKGRHTVLIIDEAQNLSREVLEQVRLLTNLETSTDKLLQIILIGQPELVHILSRHDLRQLSQRIVGRYQLKPLNLKETREYIDYRLKQAGCERPLFTRNATQRIHKLSEGIPRVINVLCDNALMGAYSEDQEKVSVGVVMRAASEVLPQRPKRRFLAGAFRVALVPLVLFAMMLAYWSGGGKEVVDRLTSEIWSQLEKTAGQDHSVEVSRTGQSKRPALQGAEFGAFPSTAVVASGERAKETTKGVDLVFSRKTQLNQN